MERSDRGPMALGAAVSIALHALVLFPLFWIGITGAAGGMDLADPYHGLDPAERRDRLSDDLPPPPEEEQDDLVRPGIEDGVANTMTWIGYDEYQEHLAKLAEVEQAAFTEEPSEGGGTPQANQNAARPAPPEVPESRPAPGTPEPPAPTPAPEPAPAPEPPAPEPPAPPVTRPPEEPIPLEPSTDPSAIPIGPEPTPEPPPETTQQPEPKPEQPPSVDPQGIPQPQQPEPPGPPPQPAAEPSPGPPGNAAGPVSPGAPSDRESQATSVVDVPPSTWRSGKPLAAKGLEIRTKNPTFPILTQLTTSPRDPVAEIFFDRTGKAVKCVILETSGYPEIDGPVTDALYRWTAKGKQLQSLKAGQTVRMRIRVILR